MRPIDADAIRRQLIDRQIIDAFFDTVRRHEIGCIIEAVDNAHTIDSVPVVRCKDCKYGEFERENRMWACVRCADYDEDFDMFTGFIEYHNEDHFCSYGDRRGE